MSSVCSAPRPTDRSSGVAGARSAIGWIRHDAWAHSRNGSVREFRAKPGLTLHRASTRLRPAGRHRLVVMIPGDSQPPFSVQDVLEAEQRIMPYLRDTPIMSAWLTRDDGSRLRVSLKLDSLQVTGGTLVRGVLNAALQMP